MYRYDDDADTLSCANLSACVCVCVCGGGIYEKEL